MSLLPKVIVIFLLKCHEPIELNPGPRKLEKNSFLSGIGILVVYFHVVS